MISGVSKRVGDALSLYNDERKHRSMLIEDGRKTMEEIMKKVEDIENRRSGKGVERDEEVTPIASIDDQNVQSPKKQENEAASIENDEDDDSGFALWLRSISQCLSNKISDDPVVRPEEVEDEEEGDEDLDEDTRCLRYEASNLYNYENFFPRLFKVCLMRRRQQK